jgi:NADH-quinone oxidoreductase subunit C
VEENSLGNLWVVLPREGFKAAMAHYRDQGFNYWPNNRGLTT